MMTATRTRTDAGLATALRISVSRLARRLRAQRTTSGMTEAVLSETQLAALSALEVHQAMTPGELAEHEKVQPPSMTRVIAVLEERNLVLRSPHPTDRRQVVLTVTEEGRALVQRVRRRKDAWLARRLAESVAAGASRAGASPPDRGRRFQPHLTLARCRMPADVTELVSALDGYQGQPWTADRVHLVRSRLGATEHPRYTSLASWPLRTPPVAADTRAGQDD